MNWDQIEGNWKQLKGNVKQQWGKLTDDDLDLVNGKREELAGKIQNAYGVNKEEAEKQLDDWQSRQADSNDELDDETFNSSNSTHTNKYGYDDNSNSNNNTPRNMSGNGPGDGTGPGDGAGVPGSDETDEMDEFNPNPMPDDLDEPTHASDNETPHEDKSIDQT